MTVPACRAAAALAAAALLSLAACAGGEPGGVVGAAASPPLAAATPAPREPATAQPVPATPAPPAIAALPPAAPPAGPRPPEDFRRLVGEKGDTVKEWMGEVVFVRRDGAAEIWRFAANSCFLDVFLYRESDGLRVAHLEARSRTTSRVTPQTCYGQIMSGRASKPAS